MKPSSHSLTEYVGEIGSQTASLHHWKPNSFTSPLEAKQLHFTFAKFTDGYLTMNRKYTSSVR